MQKEIKNVLKQDKVPLWLYIIAVIIPVLVTAVIAYFQDRILKEQLQQTDKQIEIMIQQNEITLSQSEITRNQSEIMNQQNMIALFEERFELLKFFLNLHAMSTLLNNEITLVQIKNMMSTFPNITRENMPYYLFLVLLVEDPSNINYNEYFSQRQSGFYISSSLAGFTEKLIRLRFLFSLDETILSRLEGVENLLNRIHLEYTDNSSYNSKEVIQFENPAEELVLALAKAILELNILPTLENQTQISKVN